MEKSMKKIVFLFILAFSTVMQGQTTFRYSYDDRGNRCKREIVLPTTRSAQVKDSGDETETGTDFFTESLAQHTVTIYPNPTQGELSIAITDTEHLRSGSITLYGLQGKMLIEKTIEGERTRLDLTPYLQGTYLLLLNLDGETSSWKIIKE
jgi:hypothetical protein